MVAEGGLEAAKRAKPGGKGDLSNRQIGVGEQPLCEQQAARERDLERPGPDLLDQRTVQMPGAGPELFGKVGDAAFVEGSFTDASQRDPGKIADRVDRRAAGGPTLGGTDGRGGSRPLRPLRASRGRCRRSAPGASPCRRGGSRCRWC